MTTALTKPNHQRALVLSTRRTGGPQLAAELLERFAEGQRVDQLARRHDLSPLRVARLIERHHDADSTSRAAIARAVEDIALQEIPLTDYEMRKVRNGRSIPNVRLRIAVLDWIERKNPNRGDRAKALTHPEIEAPPVTLSTVLVAAGFDYSHGRRFLGLAPASGGSSGPSTGRPPQIVNRDYAARIAAVIGADPREVGL